MASYIFNEFKHILLDDDDGVVFNVDDIATSATFIIALVTNSVSAVANKTTATFVTNWDINANANSATYSSIGYAHKRLYVTDAGGSSTTATIKYVKFADVATSAANIIWTNSTIDAYGAVIYKESNSKNVCFIDFGGKKSSNSGNFKITQNTNGFISLQ